jgi:MtN3 and saliva related transmembrane protein
MDLTGIIGIVAGTCTAISLLPQLLKILKEKKAENISITYLLVLLGGLILWVWYGIRREDMPIIATNGVSIILNVSILFAGIKYKTDKKGPDLTPDPTNTL